MRQQQAKFQIQQAQARTNMFDKKMEKYTSLDKILYEIQVCHHEFYVFMVRILRFRNFDFHDSNFNLLIN